jgi:dipeptidyl aminopeptidase/acylaminoacyl peptidase
VIDWALEQYGVSAEVGMYGISMGGDISVAAAGLDKRIVLAVPAIATTDWLRPGTNESVGEADEVAQACYDELNPLTHLECYAHCSRIIFQNRAEDQQVPPDGSVRFCDALRATHYRDYPEKMEAVLHAGAGHAYPPEMWENKVALFRDYLSGRLQEPRCRKTLHTCGSPR